MNKVAYYNGNVYTSDVTAPTAQAFVVENGRFAFVGNDADLPPCDRRIDLKGKCVIPGLVDSHCHILSGMEGAFSDMIFISPDTKPEELAGVLSSLVSENPVPMNRAVIAMGFDLTKGDFSAKDIDSAFPDQPVLICSNDGHAALVNTKAMEILGIDRDIEDFGTDSYYVRDDKGDPTGLVIEIPAMRRCKQLLKYGADIDHAGQMKALCGSYAALGYTTVFDAMSVDEDNDEMISALSTLDKEGGLTLRTVLSFGFHDEEDLSVNDLISIMEKYRDNFASDNVIPNTLKLILDGTVEEYSALLFDPYLDGKRGFGSQLLSEKDIARAAGCAADKGFSIHIHAIGDKAVHIALKALDGLGEISGTKTIAHNQLYRDDDIERIAKAGDIFFQTTPHWMVNDDYTLARLGKDRYVKQFPVGTMVKNRVAVSFGSDSCLDPGSADAFTGMFYACARGDEKLCGPQCLPPKSESISRMDALMAYTINGAKQLCIGDETGSITAGKSADFAVLDRDIINCPTEELKEVKVTETYFRGHKII